MIGDGEEVFLLKVEEEGQASADASFGVRVRAGMCWRLSRAGWEPCVYRYNGRVSLYISDNKRQQMSEEDSANTL